MLAFVPVAACFGLASVCVVQLCIASIKAKKAVYRYALSSSMLLGLAYLGQKDILDYNWHITAALFYSTEVLLYAMAATCLDLVMSAAQNPYQKSTMQNIGPPSILFLLCETASYTCILITGKVRFLSIKYFGIATTIAYAGYLFNRALLQNLFKLQSLHKKIYKQYSRQYTKSRSRSRSQGKYTKSRSRSRSQGKSKSKGTEMGTKQHNQQPHDQQRQQRQSRQHRQSRKQHWQQPQVIGPQGTTLGESETSSHIRISRIGSKDTSASPKQDILGRSPKCNIQLTQSQFQSQSQSQSDSMSQSQFQSQSQSQTKPQSELKLSSQKSSLEAGSLKGKSKIVMKRLTSCEEDDTNMQNKRTEPVEEKAVNFTQPPPQPEKESAEVKKARALRRRLITIITVACVVMSALCCFAFIVGMLMVTSEDRYAKHKYSGLQIGSMVQLQL
mmetsp:Transcript_36295/g.67055  ORF Transcript_36295/g.67055 Transcript_36295/m.67055 type:complete len:444 (-) Transcript_36295:366-1697(-)